MPPGGLPQGEDAEEEPEEDEVEAGEDNDPVLSRRPDILLAWR